MARFLSQTLNLIRTTAAKTRGGGGIRRLSALPLTAEPTISEAEAWDVEALEVSIYSKIVMRSKPDWLPFVPGASYWVPPRTSYGVSEEAEAVDVVVWACDAEAELEVWACDAEALEGSIYSKIVIRAKPDWLPFVPGASYWVPPLTSCGVSTVARSLANTRFVKDKDNLCLTMLQQDLQVLFESLMEDCCEDWADIPFFILPDSASHVGYKVVCVVDWEDPDWRFVDDNDAVCFENEPDHLFEDDDTVCFENEEPDHLVEDNNDTVCFENEEPDHLHYISGKEHY